MARPKKIKPEEPAVAGIEATVSNEGGTVTFVGDPRGGKDPEAPVYGGKSFPKGKAVPVDADWLNAYANIRKNNHFKVE